MNSFQSRAHTGENRCWPCTVTNLVLATVIAGALYLLSPLLAAAFYVTGILLIAFVGYLVPGTPHLTRQYFPKRVLAWFGKASSETPDASSDDPKADIERLIAVGALSLHDDESLTITPSFEERWAARIESLKERSRVRRESFAEIVGVDPDEVHFEEIPETEAFSVRVDGRNVSQWMSEAAFLADIAANDALSGMDSEWENLPLRERHGLLLGLRQFLNTCPLCDGSLVDEREVTESCCWSTSAITARCDGCGSRLYVVTEG